MPRFHIREAKENDIDIVFEMVKKLAKYEKLLDTFEATKEQYIRYGWGKESIFKILIAELNNLVESKVVGIALFYYTFSTFTGRPTLWLEDIFVLEEYRGKGIGTDILKQLAQTALEKGCGRMEWTVLDWNKPSWDFYINLGAKPMSDWTTFRLTVPEIQKLAET
ncbi:GNAT family N-acetyltransferase [Candidatus Bathyarchaeota archaeon]|nr:GNAT family N-acetyltransferase [Candidatus Bathyarchaeota archaeon]